MRDRILAKLSARERFTPEEGVWLYEEADLLDLGAWANAERFRRFPEREVTFIIDTNPNYTNVCNVDCHFCAFYRHAEDEDAFTYSADEVIERAKAGATLGATTMLLQGGVNPAIPYEWYLDVVRRTRAEVPEILPHFWSPAEIVGMAEVSGKTTRAVLQELYDVGQVSMPGGGAEILADSVRLRISKRKGPAVEWLRIMEECHDVGMRSTATMMFGHFETGEDVVEHLVGIRDVQDRTGGFTAFVPWSFKPGNTPYYKAIPQSAGPTTYLRVLATARLFLDNFDHIQASWFSEGKKTGQVALHFGGDDFGGTLIEEHVLKAADFHNTTTTEECLAIIREAGFAPVQRTTLYEHVRAWDQDTIEV